MRNFSLIESRERDQTKRFALVRASHKTVDILDTPMRQDYERITTLDMQKKQEKKRRGDTWKSKIVHTQTFSEPLNKCTLIDSVFKKEREMREKAHTWQRIGSQRFQ